MKMTFFETPAFTRYLADYMTDEEFRRFQNALMENPEKGDVIQGTGGFRKIRWPDRKRGKGKRGGLRVIYYFFNAEDQIWLFTIYDKNEEDDLTAEQKKALKLAIDEEKKARKL